MSNEYLPGVITTPTSLLIIAATNSFPMLITVAIGNPTTQINTYVPGMKVKLTVPRPFGMYQANDLTGQILATIGDVMALNIDSTLFDVFSIPVGVKIEAPASIAPSGSSNVEYTNGTDIFVPFKSLNNIGN